MIYICIIITLNIYIMDTKNKTTKKKGFKSTLREMNEGESVIFPRPSYGTLRNTLSLMRIEYPEKEFSMSVVENGIEILCLK